MSNGIYSKLTGYHNRRSIRLPGYDYSQPGYYFVTICIHDRKRKLFGDVKNDEMVYNEFGEYAKQCWYEIPTHFPYAQLDEFVVMPNHVHGIIRIVGDDTVTPVGVQNFEPLQDIEPLHEFCQTSKPTQNQFQHIIPRSIGSIIRGYKIGVTKMVRQQIPDTPVWQRNYYDHIIRDGTSLFFIRKYIVENPHNWTSDSENHLQREIVEFNLSEPRRK